MLMASISTIQGTQFSLDGWPPVGPGARPLKLGRQAEQGGLVPEPAQEMAPDRKPLAVPRKRHRHSRLPGDVADERERGQTRLSFSCVRSGRRRRRRGCRGSPEARREWASATRRSSRRTRRCRARACVSPGCAGGTADRLRPGPSPAKSATNGSRSPSSGSRPSRRVQSATAQPNPVAMTVVKVVQSVSQSTDGVASTTSCPRDSQRAAESITASRQSGCSGFPRSVDFENATRSFPGSAETSST